MAERAQELLVFRAEDRRFAVDSAKVREVVRAVWIEGLPGAPAEVEGLVDYRGTPTPVYDVRARFGLPLRPVHPMDHLIVVEVERGLRALRVDRAEGLVTVEALRPLDDGAKGAGLFSDSVTLEGALTLVHDPERFLTAAQVARLDAALEDAAP